MVQTQSQLETSITDSSTNPFTITSSAGSTTLGYNTLQLLIPGGATNANMYGFGIDKAGTATLMFGINKNTSSGQVPANSPYISTYNASQGISIGRGNAGMPNSSDIYISTSGGVSCTNGTLTTTVINNGTNALTTGSISGSSISISGTSSLSGTITCNAINSGGNINNGTNSMTTGSLSTTAINNGTYSLITGSIFSSSITNSGTMSSGTTTVSSITVSGDANLNSTLRYNGTTTFNVITNVGSTYSGYDTLRLAVTSPTVIFMV